MLDRYDELVRRIETLEKEMKVVMEHLNITEQEEDKVIERNKVGEYNIKVVYPGIYLQRNNPTAGFPWNRKKVAEQLKPGDLVFLYVTSPEKKIIALTRVKAPAKKIDSRWPYSVDLEYLIGPKSVGVTFEDVGIGIRPKVGDTIFSLRQDKAEEIIDLLKKQPDLDENTWQLLIDRYSHLDEV
jgi:hypothetical protein